MSASWHNTSYRKLLFDFHSPGATVGLASASDSRRGCGKKMADLLRETIEEVAKELPG